MNMNLASNLYGGAVYVQLVLFGTVAVSSVFSVKGNRKTAWMKFFGILAGAFCVGFFSDILLGEFVNYANEAAAALENYYVVQLLFFAVTCANIIYAMIPAVIVIVAVNRLYEGEKGTKIFLIILFMLVGAAVRQFFSELCYILFSPGDDGYFRMYPGYLTRYLIDSALLTLVLAAYKKALCSRLSAFLEYAQEQIRHILAVPALSFVAFELIVGTLSTYSITIMTVDPSTFLIAMFIIVSTLIVYVLMYWAIFRAVTVAAGSAKVKAELDVASKIQLSALPNKFPAFPKRKDIDIYATMHPAKEVGGDFYDFFFIDDDHLAVLIADVSGKGVPAALFMMSGRAIIRNQALLGIDPGEIFTNANRQLAENNKEGMFITAFLGIMDVRNGEFKFCNAGHNVPYRVKPDGAVTPFEMKPGFVLAGLKRTRFQTEYTTLEEEEKLFLYTDGVTEAVNTKVEMYMEPRLEENLSRCAAMNAQETVEEIAESVQSFSDGAKQADDITIVCFSRKAVKDGATGI